MSTKHTPGPWFVGANTNNDGGVSIVSDEARVCVVDAIGKFPRGQGWNHQDAARDANARLIAAAPDMLEALKAISEVGIREIHDWQAIAERMQATALAAIAKAEGV
jgi:hypothetical protein